MINLINYLNLQKMILLANRFNKKIKKFKVFSIWNKMIKRILINRAHNIVLSKANLLINVIFELI